MGRNCRPIAPANAPPVLAIRRSEPNPSDFARLGVVINFDLNFTSTVADSSLNSLLISVALSLKEGHHGGSIVISHGAGLGAPHDVAMAYVNDLDNVRTLARLDGSIPIVVTRPTVTLGGIGSLTETITVTYSLTLTARFEDDGDCGTNITQGMG
ncbi:hypothetical protein [Thalassococcus sp. S3]|uniref:hypothetical protein n=1 Tax=Thalassococcus sp. S3 TaxID=2017482 RepID=UPI00102B9F8A|nr:hypothetical protein [Thalassococcus sp. S3]